MNAKDVISNTYVKASLLVIAGLFLGWLIFHPSETPSKTTEAEVHEHSEEEHQIWTCSMHPQIRMDKEGDCPICGMDLIPLQNSNAEIDDQAIEMSESAMKLAEVQTAIVSKGTTTKDILLYGKIKVDERLQQSQTAHVPGRIEQLLINVTGEQVQKGQLIAKVYSPELVTAQKELIEALSLKDKYPAMVEASREKWRNWKLSEQQIGEIEKSGKVTSTFDIFANTSGMVSNRKVNEGDYISKGAVLFDVVGLSKVWAVFDAYESDLPWISMNQQVDFTAQAIPGKTFSGKISFIDPVVDPNTRIVQVRIELGNPGLALKPEMFINGTIHSILKGGGDQLTIPQSAVLWTGIRSVVYVKIPDAETPSFKMREITLGAAMKDTYVVVDGLTEGEEIVTNGTFSVDAAAQLAGKTSMMNKSQDSEGHTQSKTFTNNLKHVMVKVGGLCEMCKDRIETAAKSVVGVESATWEIDTKMLHLNFDSAKTSSDEVQKAIAKVGLDTEKFKAPDAVYKELPECCLYDRFIYTKNSKNELKHVMVKVGGECEMCKDRIETAAKSVVGVESATWEIDTKMLHLNFDSAKTSSDEVQKAIAKVGHDTEKFKAPDEIYKELPECCLYERFK